MYDISLVHTIGLFDVFGIVSNIMARWNVLFLYVINFQNAIKDGGSTALYAACITLLTLLTLLTWFTLLTLFTLLILFKLLYTPLTVTCMPVYIVREG